MSNSVFYKGVRISEEQFNRIQNIKDLPDAEIDYSDIPPTTKEELKKFKPARLRKKNLQVAS